MFTEIVGSLELTSLVPGSWRLSASMVLQTTALAVVIYVIYRSLRLIQYVRWVNKVYGEMPGPRERHWFFGSLYYFPKGEAERLQHFLDLCNKYGEKGYVRIWIGPLKPVIILCAPDTTKRLLKTAEPKSKGISGGYRMLTPWLGEGLLIAGGEKWARKRRLLTPAFHFDILKPYINVYNKSADIFIENLDKYAENGEKFDIFQEVCKCTLDIILKCAFSYEKDVQRLGETDPYVKAVADISVGAAERFACLTKFYRRPYLFPDFSWNLSSFGRKFNKDCSFVHSVAEEIINKRRHTLEKEGELERLQNRKYLDFLDILLSAKDENGKGMSQLEIRNEVDTFLFEGHDTTASGISWILYSLAKHPEYQKKCQEEIDRIFNGRDPTDVEWKDLNELEYLTMCIKEGMRLHCPVPIVGRQIQHELDIGDRVLPKETALSVNIWALHHNKKFWDRDMEFIPERFSEENILKMDHFQYVPFSAGPRNCIGQHFAMNEEKVVLAKLLRNFTFELVTGHVVRKRDAVVMRAEDGIMMYVKRRQNL